MIRKRLSAWVTPSAFASISTLSKYVTNLALTVALTDVFPEGSLVPSVACRPVMLEAAVGSTRCLLYKS